MREHDYFLPGVLLTLVAALLLYAVPLRSEAAFWRPPFIMLVTLYWLTSEPYRFGMGAAWLSGLTLDLVFGHTLGQHALAVAMCAYLVLLSGEGLRRFPLLHQCGMVFLLGIVYQSVIVVTELALQRPALIWSMFYPALSAALLWPLIGLPMQHFHRES